MQPRQNLVPALSVFALGAMVAAFSFPSMAFLFWVLAGVLSVAAAVLAYRTQAVFGQPRSALLSILFTVAGLVIGVLLLQLI